MIGMSSYMPQSKSDVHLTPDRVFDIIKEKWGYSKNEMFDPCPENPKFNGLGINWKNLNFVNPPYTLLKEFVYKAIKETDIGRKTIMLLPCKTDQHWFHELKPWWDQIIWIEKRLKFKNNKWAATQPHFLIMID